MKKYNCPDCEVVCIKTNIDICSHCKRFIKKSKEKSLFNNIDIRQDIYNSNSCVPPHCIKCSNHPTNGGSGICFCTLGTIQITY